MIGEEVNRGKPRTVLRARDTRRGRQKSSLSPGITLPTLQLARHAYGFRARRAGAVAFRRPGAVHLGQMHST